MNKLTKWVNDKLGVTKLIANTVMMQHEIRILKERLTNLEEQIHAMDRIDMDFDLHKRGQNTIVLTGCYKGKGYVQFYDIPHEEFIHYVERLQHERKHNLIRNTDCPPSVKAYFNFK